MYVLSEPGTVDTLLHRYGADCFGAASYFSRLSPRRLNRAIVTAAEKQADEMLFLRWCISGGGISFAEFRQRIFSPPKRESAKEILGRVEQILDNTDWRRDCGAKYL